MASNLWAQIPRKNLCRLDNLKACLPLSSSLKLEESKASTQLKLIQLKKTDIQELCTSGTVPCLKMGIKEVSELALLTSEAINTTKDATGPCLQDSSSSTGGIRPSLRLSLGVIPYSIKGSANDFPRTAILGIGGGIVFCHGKCQAFLDIRGALGSKDQIVQSHYKELEGKVSFTWMPINIKNRIKLGLGPDLSIRRGQLIHNDRDAEMVSDVLSLGFGTHFTGEVKILDVGKKIKGQNHKAISLSIGLDGGLYFQSILKACQNFRDSKGSSSQCYNSKQMNLIDEFPLSGAVIESIFYLKGTFN